MLVHILFSLWTKVVSIRVQKLWKHFMIYQTKRIENKKNWWTRKYFKISALLSVQWLMISRIDDMRHLQYTNFSNHLEFPFTLQLQLRWYKNIVDEQLCPHQIVIGAMDPYYVSFSILEHPLSLRALETILKKVMSLYLETGWKNYLNVPRRNYHWPCLQGSSQGPLGDTLFQKGSSNIC